MKSEKWTLGKLPPKNHPDVAQFAEEMFQMADDEKIRLGKNDTFLANYELYRGNQDKRFKKNTFLSVNLYFANIERTVANITARRPQGEVVDLDGGDDGAEKILNKVLVRWWKETNQHNATKDFARQMETYGIGIEKPYFDKITGKPKTMSVDPFAFFPAPGNWFDIATQAPFVCFIYQDFIYKVEEVYKVDGVKPEDAYELLGLEREENYNSSIGTQGIRGSKASARQENYADPKAELCLVKELWIRDSATKTVTIEEPVVDDEGNPVFDAKGQLASKKVSRQEPVYLDRIRKITYALGENGYIVLDDTANPNINLRIEPELIKETYPFGRLPVYKQNSYKDMVGIWGFAASEQVGDLIVDINKIINRLKSYVLNVMSPPLIVQKNCGISRAQIRSELESYGRLVLMPQIPNARIEFMQIPSLPSTFFNVLEILTNYFDRIYATEAADRGQAPSGVIAASAIIALQERNQVVMQAKTSAIEEMVVEKSRWMIGLYQNFGSDIETVNIAGDKVEFIGSLYAGRNFSYVVESGSTTPKTNLQKIESVRWLWETKAIDQQATLEMLGVDNWQDIVERTAETQLGQALQLLIDAGLPEEKAMELQQFLSESGQLKNANI